MNTEISKHILTVSPVVAHLIRTDNKSTLDVRVEDLQPMDWRFKSIILQIDYFSLKSTWRHIRLCIIDSYVYGSASTSCVTQQRCHPHEIHSGPIKRNQDEMNQPTHSFHTSMVPSRYVKSRSWLYESCIDTWCNFIKKLFVTAFLRVRGALMCFLQTARHTDWTPLTA